MIQPDTALRRAARQLWEAIEPLHMLVYFHQAPIEAGRRLGLRGYWMTYFAGRFSPLGCPPATTVTALAYGFAPSRVQRAIPDAWRLAHPEVVTHTWIAAAATALEDALPPSALKGFELLGPVLWELASACRVDGRALAAAWAGVDRPDKPTASAWLAATILREHRGDGHVSACLNAGMSGIDAAVTHAASGAVPLSSLEASRGWTATQLDACLLKLTTEGVLDPGGGLTNKGRAMRRRVETRTDQLAAEPLRSVDIDLVLQAVGIAAPLSRHLIDSGLIPTPNPVGARRP